MMKLIAFLLLPSLVAAFAPILVGNAVSTEGMKFSTTSLNMAPKFDKTQNKWLPTSPEEESEAGYDIWGSLLRQGPNPFFNRLFRGEEYEQGVLKFMAGDKVDRNTAQAEMDAYLQNPNDWAYNRLNGYNVDYLTLDKKKIALTLIWATGICTLGGRGLLCAITGENYWSFLH